MKLSNRGITISTAVLIGLSVGIVIGANFSFPIANAAPKGLVLTGTFAFPDKAGVGSPVDRIEDTETGIVCYLWSSSGASLGCAKR